MEEIIGIYIKLVLAFLGFVAPSVTLIISVLYKGFYLKRQKLETELIQYQELIKEMFNKNEECDFRKNLEDTLKKYNTKENEINKKLKLLNPKRQIIRIFISLLFALFMIVFNYIPKNIEPVVSYESGINNLLLILSFISFIYALYALWQFFVTVIDTRASMLEEELSETIKPETEA